MLTAIEAGTWNLPAFSDAVIQACPDGEKIAFLKRLWFGKSTHDGHLDEHTPLDIDADGRHHVRAGSPSKFQIHWIIEGFDNLVEADLQIYDKDSNVMTLYPIKKDRGCYEGTVEPGWDRAEAKTFTCANGPYLVRLRIIKAQPSTKVPVKARRLYFNIAPLIVVGGGIAGIRSAQQLLEYRKTEDVVLLEARNYLGGRARTEDWNDFKVDIGCQFLQDADDNELVQLAKEYKLETFWHYQDEQFKVGWIDDFETALEDAQGYATVGANKEDRSYLESLRVKIRLNLTDKRCEELRDQHSADTREKLENDRKNLLADPEFIDQCKPKYLAVLQKNFDDIAEQRQSYLALEQTIQDQQAELITANLEASQVPPLKEGESAKERDKHPALSKVRTLVALINSNSKKLINKKNAIANLEEQQAGKDNESQVYVAGRLKWMQQQAEEQIAAGAAAKKRKWKREWRREVSEQVAPMVEEVANRPLVRLLIAPTAELDEGADPSLFTLHQEGEPSDPEEVEDEAEGDEPIAEVAPIEQAASTAAELRGTSNRLAKGGYGALIDHHATKLRKDNPQRLCVYLECKVSEICTPDADALVKITCSKGVLYGCGLVLTVPTQTIKAITFTPDLPAEIRSAFDNLPMGHYKKTFLPLIPDSTIGKRLTAKKDREELADGDETDTDGENDPVEKSALDAQDDQEPNQGEGSNTEDDADSKGEPDISLFTIEESGRAWWFLYRISQNLIVAFLGGEHARLADYLEAAELADQALSALAGALEMKPENAKAEWTGKLKTSTWSKDELSCGAYTYTKPNGGAKARRDLRAGVVAKRMVFAGEAVRQSKDEYATAHGAWLSGDDAARLLLENLGTPVPEKI